MPLCAGPVLARRAHVSDMAEAMFRHVLYWKKSATSRWGLS